MQWQEFESNIDMPLSNCSIGADAPAAACGKNAAQEGKNEDPNGNIKTERTAEKEEHGGGVF